MKRLTMPRLIIAIAFISLFAMAVRAAADSDMWWHLRSGQLMVESRTLLLSDPFSHTRAGQPWINHGWLAQIVLYAAYALGSFAALSILIALLVVVAFIFAWKQMEGGPLLRAFILVLAAMTSAVIWAPRPQMFSFALTAVVGYIVYLYKWKQIDRLWLLPVVFVLWVNVHGGFAIGFILLAGAIAGEVINHLLRYEAPEVLSWSQLIRLAAFTLGSFALLVVNPNTVEMYTYPLRTINIGVLRDFIQEWSSPDFHALFVQPFIWLFAATLAAIGWSGRRLDGGDFALVAGFAYSALLAGRNIAPFALVCAPVLARHARAALEAWVQRRGWAARSRAGQGVIALNWIILIAVILLAALKVLVAIVPVSQQQTEREGLPVDAIEWIETNRPEGLMFNSYNWGGYLIWRLWPEYKVYVDGRTDLYDDAFLRDYLKVIQAQPGFESILDRDQVDWMLIEANSALDVLLARDANWQDVYRDDRAAIFTRRSP